MQTPAGELQGSSSPLKLMIPLRLPEFPRQESKDCSAPRQSKEHKEQQGATDAVRKFCYWTWAPVLGKLNDSQLLGTKAAGFVQHLDEKLQGHKLILWSIFVTLMQVNGRG